MICLFPFIKQFLKTSRRGGRRWVGVGGGLNKQSHFLSYQSTGRGTKKEISERNIKKKYQKYQKEISTRKIRNIRNIERNIRMKYQSTGRGTKNKEIVSGNIFKNILSAKYFLK